MIAFNATDAETFPNFSVATAENDRVTAAQRVRWAQPHRGARETLGKSFRNSSRESPASR